MKTILKIALAAGLTIAGIAVSDGCLKCGYLTPCYYY
jgi:hypothetical protein